MVNCYADPFCTGSAGVSREWRQPYRWTRSQDHGTSTTVGTRCAAETATGIHRASASPHDGRPDSTGTAATIWCTRQAASTAFATRQLTFTTGSKERRCTRWNTTSDSCDYTGASYGASARWHPHTYGPVARSDGCTAAVNRSIGISSTES